MKIDNTIIKSRVKNKKLINIQKEKNNSNNSKITIINSTKKFLIKIKKESLAYDNRNYCTNNI